MLKCEAFPQTEITLLEQRGFSMEGKKKKRCLVTSERLFEIGIPAQKIKL